MENGKDLKVLVGEDIAGDENRKALWDDVEKVRAWETPSGGECPCQ